MRALLEEFAKSRQMDPLIPDNWYPIRYKHIVSAQVISSSAQFSPPSSFYPLSFFENEKKVTIVGQGYSSILAYFNTVPHAVMALFPEIGLDETKFEFHQSIYLLYFILFASSSPRFHHLSYLVLFQLFKGGRILEREESSSKSLRLKTISIRLLLGTGTKSILTLSRTARYFSSSFFSIFHVLPTRSLPLFC